jgi:hypothetical protein
MLPAGAAEEAHGKAENKNDCVSLDREPEVRHQFITIITLCAF